MNNIYTDIFSENLFSQHYEYKQKYTSKKGKQSYNNSNETSFTKKAKSSHSSDYKQQRDAKRMNWEGYEISEFAVRNVNIGYQSVNVV